MKSTDLEKTSRLIKATNEIHQQLRYLENYNEAFDFVDLSADYVPTPVRVKFLLPHARKQYQKLVAELKALGVTYEARKI